MFGMNVLTPFSGVIQASSKQLWNVGILYQIEGITSKKTVIFIFIAMRTSNLTNFHIHCTDISTHNTNVITLCPSTFSNVFIFSHSVCIYNKQTVQREHNMSCFKPYFCLLRHTTWEICTTDKNALCNHSVYWTVNGMISIEDPKMLQNNASTNLPSHE